MSHSSINHLTLVTGQVAMMDNGAAPSPLVLFAPIIMLIGLLKTKVELMPV